MPFLKTLNVEIRKLENFNILLTVNFLKHLNMYFKNLNFCAWIIIKKRMHLPSLAQQIRDTGFKVSDDASISSLSRYIANLAVL